MSPHFRLHYGLASATAPGVVTTAAQSIAGAKTFLADLQVGQASGGTQNGHIKVLSSDTLPALQWKYGGTTTAQITGVDTGSLYCDVTGTLHFRNAILGGTTLFQINVNSSSLACGAPLGLKSYTVATLPAATTAGQMIYVSNESGGATPAFSDGTNWRRVADRAVVS